MARLGDLLRVLQGCRMVLTSRNRPLPALSSRLSVISPLNNALGVETSTKASLGSTVKQATAANNSTYQPVNSVSPPTISSSIVPTPTIPISTIPTPTISPSSVPITTTPMTPALPIPHIPPMIPTAQTSPTSILAATYKTVYSPTPVSIPTLPSTLTIPTTSTTPTPIFELALSTQTPPTSVLCVKPIVNPVITTTTEEPIFELALSTQIPPTTNTINTTKEPATTELLLPTLTDTVTTTTTEVPITTPNNITTINPSIDPPFPTTSPSQQLHQQSRERKVPTSQISLPPVFYPFATSRLLYVSGLAASLGWGALGEKMKRAIVGGDHKYPAVLNEANAERLAQGLSRMRGAALKVGQMLSIQDEAIVPPQFQSILERVRRSADAMPPKQLERTMTEEFGPNWRGSFRQFDDKPIAAASIGQVHRATTLDGEEVAVKVQYPGTAESVDSDIANLGILLKMVLPAGMFLPKLLKSTRDELLRETDYVLEAQHQERFRMLLAEYKEFSVPRVIGSLSTKRVLTSTFIHGVPLEKLMHVEVNQEIRNWVAAQLLRLCLEELFSFNFMQTDPNWANFFYNHEQKKLHVLDFGASRSFSEKFIRGYFAVIHAAVRGDRMGVLESSRTLGFLTGEETDVMNNAHIDAVMILGEPFATPGEFDFHKHNIAQKVQGLIPVMLKHRLVPPPEETYSLHRKLSGTIQACTKLHARVDSHQIFDEVSKKFMLPKI